MRTLQLRRYFTLIAFSLLVPMALAASHDKIDGQPIYTMAEILIHLNHYPSAEEKLKLQEITASTEHTDAVKSIAQAMHDMQHSVSAENMKKLQAIVDSEDADHSVKKLATILMSINHKPDDEAKAMLEELKNSIKKM